MSDGSSGDVFTEVTERSWLGRLAGSLMAALFGLALFLASFVLLYWNEGRAVAALDSLNAGARGVVSVPATPVDPAHEGALVHVTGPATVAAGLTDPVFHASATGALRLRRQVQMYQWRQHEESHTEKRIGGGETTHTTYSYTKEWSESAIDSTRFKQPNGHANPPMSLHSTVFDAAAQLGGFRLDAALVREMSSFKSWTPPASVTGADVSPAFQRNGDGFYHGAKPEAPEIGDMQVSYGLLEVQPVSVVAAQIGSGLAPFHSANGREIGLVDLGTHSAAEMFKEAKAAESTITWILRGVGFVMMVIGLALGSAPVAWFASLLPLLEDLVEIAGFFLALCLAIPLTLLTIAIAWLAHASVDRRRPDRGGAGARLRAAAHRAAPARPYRRAGMTAAPWSLKTAALGGLIAGVLLTLLSAYQQGSAELDVARIGARALGGGVALSMLATGVTVIRNFLVARRR
ncbi:MAG: TMEM43 family protein [Pseudomonadota bacterium]